jgi:hypothetical protein
MSMAQLEPADHADPRDLEALDVLTDEYADEGIMHRDDARIDASRRLYVARAVSGST